MAMAVTGAVTIISPVITRKHAKKYLIIVNT
jgi:hypothetical protein